MSSREEDYLWDRSGDPDNGIAEFEELLSGLRYQARPLVLSIGHSKRRSGLVWSIPALTGAVLVILVVALNYWRLQWNPEAPWKVRALQGEPTIDSAPVLAVGRLSVGQTLRTNASSRAELRVARIGKIEVEPSTDLALLATESHRHRIVLRRGKISAQIFAPPWSLSAELPSATAFDLGCAFTLEVANDQSGHLWVSSGWVQLDSMGLQTLVPEGGRADVLSGFPPGSPYFDDATPAFKLAVHKLNFERLDKPDRLAALEVVLDQTRRRDLITLLNLIPRSTPSEREQLFNRIAQFVPPPSGTTREKILNGNERMMDAWWDALGYRSAKRWWLNWKDGLFF